MSQEQWTAVDRYLTELLVPPDAVLEDVLRASAEAGLPPINVAPNQGRLIHLLALIRGARNILEIGTLGGYSTVWLARALPLDGHLVTLEFDARHAEVARANLARAGLGDLVEVRVGPALETLPRLAEEGRGPFDLVFIDADKPSTPDYVEWAVKLSRRGTVIIVDNVVRNGGVIDSAGDANSVGVQRALEVMARDSRLSATAIQTVGVKGYDGLAIAVVIRDPD